MACLANFPSLLDRVFAIPTKQFAKYQIEHIPYYLQTVFLRRKLPPKRPLIESDEDFGQEDYNSKNDRQNINEKDSA